LPPASSIAADGTAATSGRTRPKQRQPHGRRGHDSIDLATIRTFIIAFAVFVDVVRDGFDLGLGRLSRCFPQTVTMTSLSTASLWDGKQSWSGSAVAT
jgi:hypothetical protein